MVAGVAWALLVTGTFLFRHESSSKPPPNRPIEAPLEPDFVTSDSCRSCHPGNYASWHASFHRTMTQVARPENFAADLNGVELNDGTTAFRVERGEKAYFVRSKPIDAPASAYGKPHEIVLLTGSHHLQIFWTETGDSREGRTLGQFPFAYMIAEKKFTPMVQTFLVPPGHAAVYSKGDWNNGCINCHVTQGRGRFVAGSKFDSQAVEFGISCEACHSGGREHVERNRNPLRRFSLHLSGKPDPTIANPSRMDGPAAALVCGQCHSIWAFDNAAANITWDKSGGKYRPGAKQLDLRWVVQPTGTDHPEARKELFQLDKYYVGDRFWPDGMVRVTGREYNGTEASPCFKGGKFSCISCHERHPTDTSAASLEEWRTTRQMAPKMETNEACYQCHADKRVKLAAHTHHAPESSGSSCYNCHMPHTTYGLLRSIRAHQISSPSVKTNLETGRPNACNLCHLDQTLAWTAGKLNEWYNQPVPALGPDDQELSAAVQLLLKGDAGQRMLIAWSMGWAPAQKASGNEWFYPFLIFELNDPYAAVRFGAWKALQTLPGFANYEFDYRMDDAHQKEALTLAYQYWWQNVRKPSGRFQTPVVLEPSGIFRQDIFDRLLDQRSNRKMFLAE